MLTKKSIDDLKPRDTLYRVPDHQIKALKLCVYPSGSKVWKVIKRIRGKSAPVTVTIGEYPAITIQQARADAGKHLSELAQGASPNEANKKAAALRMTLQDAFDRYVQSKPIAASTLKDYQRAMDSYLATWKNKDIAVITPEMVIKHYHDGCRKSIARENQAMRVFRAVYNYAYRTALDSHRRPILPANPADVLSAEKLWKKLRRKKTLIRQAELVGWLDALDALREDYKSPNAERFHAYIKTMLFTGLRGDELRRLARDKTTFNKINAGAKPLEMAKGYYDQSGRMLVFHDSKGIHEEAEIPLSSQAIMAIDGVAKLGGEWLFGRGELRPRHDDFRLAFDWIGKKCGTRVTGHDVRRTFATIAEQLELSPYTIKRLLGHKTNDEDVTGGYIIQGESRLRKASEAIANAILEAARHQP